MTFLSLLTLIVFYYLFFFFFFFNDTATTEIYTLSLHDALPISTGREVFKAAIIANAHGLILGHNHPSGSLEDRKSTRLNSSHQIISYAVFCLKKKKKKMNNMGWTIN